jgi:hypothetical protein
MATAPSLGAEIEDWTSASTAALLGFVGSGSLGNSTFKRCNFVWFVFDYFFFFGGREMTRYKDKRQGREGGWGVGYVVGEDLFCVVQALLSGVVLIRNA